MEALSADPDRRDAQLRSVAQEAALLREMAGTPGYKILVRFIEDRVEKAKGQWMKAKSPEECWKIKLQAEPWQAVLDIVNHRILLGEKVTELLQEKQDLNSL